MRKIRELERNISPVFKDFDKSNLTQREIYKATNKSNQQWYLGKKTKDPVVEHVNRLGDYKVHKKPNPNHDDLIDGPEKKM